MIFPVSDPTGTRLNQLSILSALLRRKGRTSFRISTKTFQYEAGRLYSIIADICAFANTNGGTLFLGLSADARKPIVGISNPEQAIPQLEKEISSRISPQLQITIDAHETNGKKILRVLVPKGEDPPYVVDDYKIYVRDESETGLAVRDEIVSPRASSLPSHA